MDKEKQQERPCQEPDSFEMQLTQELRRVQAPPDFVDRVMLKCISLHPPMRPPLTWPVAKWVGSGVAAALLVGAGLAGEMEHRRQEKLHAEQEFNTAMQVTSHALEQTRQQLSRAGFRLADHRD